MVPNCGVPTRTSQPVLNTTGGQRLTQVREISDCRGKSGNRTARGVVQRHEHGESGVGFVVQCAGADIVLPGDITGQHLT